MDLQAWDHRESFSNFYFYGLGHQPSCHIILASSHKSGAYGHMSYRPHVLQLTMVLVLWMVGCWAMHKVQVRLSRKKWHEEERLWKTDSCYLKSMLLFFLCTKLDYISQTSLQLGMPMWLSSSQWVVNRYRMFSSSISTPEKSRLPFPPCYFPLMTGRNGDNSHLGSHNLKMTHSPSAWSWIIA